MFDRFLAAFLTDPNMNFMKFPRLCRAIVDGCGIVIVFRLVPRLVFSEINKSFTETPSWAGLWMKEEDFPLS